MNDFSYGSIAIFYIIFALGTVWGITRVVFPLLKITWTILRYTVLVGLLIAPLFSGIWFRMFGYDGGDIISFPIPKEHTLNVRRHREIIYDLNGNYEPNWRENRGLPPLPKDWDGESQHRWPAVASLLVPAGLFGIYALVNTLHSVSNGGAPTWHKYPKERPLNKPLKKSIPNTPTPVSMPVAQKPKRVVSDTNEDFTTALKGLGYKAGEINRVMPQCTEMDLEGRVRHALRILSRRK